MIRYHDNGEREESFRERLSVVCSNHIHPMVEMVFVADGFTVASINGKPFRAEKGDIVISPPNTIHGYIDQRGRENCFYIIVFNLEDYPEYKNLPLLNYPVIKNAITPDFLSLLSSCRNIYNNGNTRSNVRHNIISTIISYALSKGTFSAKKDEAPSLSTDLYDYCNKNYTRDITLAEVAAALNMSPSTLSRIFSQKINMSFREYINMLRIGNAKHLLMSTDKPIFIIAEECGFKTIRTFNRVFIKAVGITPREYRKIDNNYEYHQTYI